MGVPKFFRWLSERYPLINQPIHCPPNEETKRAHGFPSSSNGGGEEQFYVKKNTDLPHIMPEFDRLYLDMNGIIHCSSHNNAEEEVFDNDVEGGDENAHVYAVPQITEEQIFQNVCYYVDRIVSDIVQPKQLVFLAIDGVAPRAKLNQQRSRRYRSGTEREIEKHLMTLQRVQGSGEGGGGGVMGDEVNEDDISKEYLLEADGGAFDRYRPFSSASDVENGNTITTTTTRGAQRFSGTIDTSSNTASISATVGESSGDGSENDDNPGSRFHSNCITPGTPFLHKCSQHILSFIQDKLQNDPKWHNLTIIFSGHDVPGEGEHKIMEFIRHEKHKPNYDPNTSHCIFGQDGDLVMLGLAMHEPHTCLLREEVVFDPTRKKAKEKLAKLEGEMVASGGENNDIDDSNGVERLEMSITESNQPTLSGAVQSYIHNANFELLHISILREYLGLEFETKEFDSRSKFELEPTIDDFVFMTFFVGNDFLPHLPALDIGDEAFDLLFYAYKKNRTKWLKDGFYSRSMATSTEVNDKTKSKRHPYLTDAGRITSGVRLESFLADLGSYEDPYYRNKQESMEEENERIRKQDKKYGRETLIPSQEVLDQVELADRELYQNMLRQNAPTEDESEEDDDDDNDEQVEQQVTASDTELMRKIGGIFRWSLSPIDGGVAKVDAKKNEEVSENSLVDLKGRYYFEKFGITPFEAEKHFALRKEYITGLVWNLEYYYKGVISWEWYYPYNYGPMLSDLSGISSILFRVSFDDKTEEGREVNISDTTRRVAGSPLRPFEQLLGCLPPSSSYLLPKPYRWLMTSTDSPLIDFYPETFTVDMNGKRWPWEAVALLPFIDSTKLIQASRSLIDESELTDEEKRLNEFGETYVLTRCMTHDVAKIETINKTAWANLKEDANVAFQPMLNSSTTTPGTSFPTLRNAPIKRLNRRKVFLNIFGLRSRYRTALLEMDDLPAFPPAALLAQTFIGQTINFRYPILYEGFVCSVADATTVYRGNEKPRKHSANARAKRPLLIAKMFKELQTGEGMTGTGGWILPQVDITLTLRPLEAIETLPDGTRVKVYARREIEIPFVAALFSPSQRDPRLDIPAKLEKNPFIFGGQSRLEKYVATEMLQLQTPLREAVGNTERFTGKQSTMSARGFSTYPAWKTATAGTRVCKHQTFMNPPRSSFHTTSVQLARRGSPRQRVVGAAGMIAMSAFFFTACLMQLSAAHVPRTALPTLSTHGLSVRGGDVELHQEMFDPPLSPPVQFEHGTTTISFVFQGGIVAAVDSRASIGNFVGSKTVQKVLPVSKNILGTMAGGAADCSFWIRMLHSEAKLHELLHDSRGISVARASRLISNAMYQNRALDLSVGTMIMGYHPRDGFQIYYVDNTGVRIQGDMFAVGSGSTFALGILDTEERRFEMTEEEAVSLGIRAIRHATLRDAGSGGWIGVYLITKDGWRKVFSEDLASIQ